MADKADAWAQIIWWNAAGAVGRMEWPAGWSNGSEHPFRFEQRITTDHALTRPPRRASEEQDRGSRCMAASKGVKPRRAATSKALTTRASGSGLVSDRSGAGFLPTSHQTDALRLSKHHRRRRVMCGTFSERDRRLGTLRTVRSVATRVSGWHAGINFIFYCRFNLIRWAVPRARAVPDEILGTEPMAQRSLAPTQMTTHHTTY